MEAPSRGLLSKGNRFDTRMTAQISRDPWHTIWRIVTGDGLLSTLLLAVSAGLIVASQLPQMPTDNPIAYAQWLSDVHARFGSTAPALEAWGLFGVTRSPGFRGLLALLGGCLALRLFETADGLRRQRQPTAPSSEWQTLQNTHLDKAVGKLRRQRYRVVGKADSLPALFQVDRWPWASALRMAAQSGALLMLVGLMITALWGQRVEGVVVKAGERVTLPGADRWVELGKETLEVTHAPGIVASVEALGAGVRVSATDSGGHSLQLQQSIRAEPTEYLDITFAENTFTTGAYFAIPATSLVIALEPEPDNGITPQTPIRLRVYRSPSADLATETIVDGNAKLVVDDATIELTSRPYALLTATFNPGAGITGVGLAILIAGLLGSITWPARRLWLRENGTRVEATGDIPPVLMSEEEA